MSGDRQKILIVEDDLDLAEMLNAYFTMQGYDTQAVALGQEAVECAWEFLPDLIVLDIRLPDIDGFEVRHLLEERHKTRNIPVLFLTEKNDRVDKLQGLEMGGVDYITKPFDIQELRLRVRNALRRAAVGVLENTITGLPEGLAVDEALQNSLIKPDTHMLAIALRGLDMFRELYGFVAADDVLRVTAFTVRNAGTEIGGPSVFCGHLEDDVFVILIPGNQISSLQQRIIERIGQALEYFYPGDNRGPNAYTEDRLRLVMGQFNLQDEPVESIALLKESVLHQVQENIQI